ncbi:OTU domain-containing protein, partial [Haematococcus lacustris]
MEKVVKGDGACQFRSLSDQLYGDADHHAFVRQQVVQHLRAHAAQYSPFVPDSGYDSYCADMGKQGTWGDHVTLQAAADHFGLRINVLSSYPDTAVLTILPESTKSQRVLWLSFWAEVHYNSLYPRHDPPVKAPSPSRKILGSKMLGRLVPRSQLS